mmetsp:Transcript_60861/g.157918  ORF Transcript_60861/g.157918 Transcript_60861/m.157918 type:complete len:237 (+) Transcript_60861:157-867(+)
MVRPMNQFCCGCSLSFGVMLILVFNLIINLFYVYTAFSNIILRIPTFGFNASPSTQTFNAALCLLGFPFIFSGIWGVIYRSENFLKLYFYYLLFAFALDISFLVSFYALNDVCSMMPSFLTRHGAAFACGFMRISSTLFVIQVVIVELYCIFTVWSLCEDWATGCSGQGFPELLRDRGEPAMGKRRLAGGAYHRDELVGPSSVGYGSFQGAPALNSSEKIFRGKYHETSFPPMRLD